MGRRSWFRGVLFVMVAATTGLACAVSLGGPQPPSERIPISTEAVSDLISSWVALGESSQSGEAAIIVTEEQLTSFLWVALSAQPNPPITDPQVYLQNGLIRIYGKAQGGFVTANALIELSAGVGPDGNIELAVVSADFGPLPVPDTLLQTLSDAITGAFTGELGSLATGIKITNLAIVDGEMAITGTFR